MNNFSKQLRINLFHLGDNADFMFLQTQRVQQWEKDYSKYMIVLQCKLFPHIHYHSRGNIQLRTFCKIQENLQD